MRTWKAVSLAVVVASAPLALADEVAGNAPANTDEAKVEVILKSPHKRPVVLKFTQSVTSESAAPPFVGAAPFVAGQTLPMPFVGERPNVDASTRPYFGEKPTIQPPTEPTSVQIPAVPEKP